MFSFPSPASPSRASTFLRDSWQEEEGLDPNTRWPGPGELNSLLTVPHLSLQWTHSSSSWHFPTAYVFHIAMQVLLVLWKLRLFWWIVCSLKFSLASCFPFQFPTSFSNTQLHLQAYSFSLVGWLKKHERDSLVHLSFMALSGKGSIFLELIVYWVMKNVEKIIVSSMFLRENIHYEQQLTWKSPHRAFLRRSLRLRLSPQARRMVVCFGKSNLKQRGQGHSWRIQR